MLFTRVELYHLRRCSIRSQSVSGTIVAGAASNVKPVVILFCKRIVVSVRSSPRVHWLAPTSPIGACTSKDGRTDLIAFHLATVNAPGRQTDRPQNPSMGFTPVNAKLYSARWLAATGFQIDAFRTFRGVVVASMPRSQSLIQACTSSPQNWVSASRSSRYSGSKWRSTTLRKTIVE